MKYTTRIIILKSGKYFSAKKLCMRDSELLNDEGLSCLSALHIR